MRNILIALLALSISAHAAKTTLTGAITDAQGNPLNGTLTMKLPVPAQDPTTQSAIQPTPVTFNVVNGQITGGAQLYDLATIQPLNLWYQARAYDNANNLVFYGNYFVTGATFNLGAATPTVITTSNISYLNPVQPVTGVINATSYGGVDMCAKINAAMLANPSLPIDARGFTGNQPCSSNPFAGQTADLQLFLGAVRIQTTAPWVTVSTHETRVIGTTRANLSSPSATTIQAVSGFPATCDGLPTNQCAIFREGDNSGGSNGAFNNIIEHITLDCNNTGAGTAVAAIGLYSTDIQEQSGAEWFEILNCPVYGAYFNGSAQPAGAGAENFTLEHGEIYSFASSTTSTVGVEVINSATPATNARILRDITVSTSATVHGAAGFQFQQTNNGVLEGLNAEQFVTGYDLGPNSKPVNGIALVGVTCGVNTTQCVWIHTGSTNIDLSTIENGSGNSANCSAGASCTIRDDTAIPSGNFVTDFLITHYTTATAGATRFNTSVNPANSGNGNLFPWMSVTDTGGSLGFFSVTENSDHTVQLQLNSGVTAAQGQSLNFVDRGAGKWVAGNTGSAAGASNANAFQIFDTVSNFPRLFMANTSPNTGFTSLSSGTGSAAVEINSTTSAGTGGLRVWSGGATPAVQVSMSGAGQVTTVGAILGGDTNLTCTMVAGTCSANLSHTYAGAPACYANWTSSGTFTGILKVTSSTTQGTVTSTVGTDTGQFHIACFGS